MSELIHNKRNQKNFIFAFLTGVILYSLLVTNELVNTYDGLWNGFYRQIFTWEISIGRWLWPVADGLRRFVSADPLTSVFTLAIYAFANVLIMDMLFRYAGKMRYIALGILMVNTGVCVQLSYRFNAIAFALAYLCGVASAYFIYQWKDQKSALYLVLSVILAACTMGLYQADIGITCLLVIILFIRRIIDDELKSSVVYLLISGIVVVVSCLIYKLIWNSVMAFFHITAASYNGANSLSIFTMIKDMPSRIVFAYKTFFAYFTNGSFHNIYNVYNLPLIILMALVIYLLIQLSVQTQSAAKMILIALMMLLVPIASNIALLLAVQSTAMIQMSLPMAIVVPLLMSLIEKNRMHSIAYDVLLVALCVLLFGNAMQTSIDQHAMYVGRRNTLNLINRVASDLPAEAYHTKLVVAGVPSDNPTFKKDEIWNMANLYARYGQIYTPANGITNSYKGLFRDAGINVNLERNISKYHQISESDEVKRMPVYPQQGAIKKIGDHYVVKIS